MHERLSEAWRRIGPARAVIFAFFVGLCVLGAVRGVDAARLWSDTFVRFGMNAILVLAMVPAIQCGTGLNFGLPIGILCGLVGMLVGIERGEDGFTGFAVAAAIGAGLAIPAGWAYARLLRAVQGQEMIVGTYIAFSVVSGMCIFWLEAPFKSPEIVWPYGKSGARTTIDLTTHYKQVLDRAWQVRISSDGVSWVDSTPGAPVPPGGRGVILPTGLLLAAIAGCLGYALFSRTRLGLAMQAAGANPRFARQSGVRVEACRTIGVVLSTAIGAVGIVVFAQSLGFVQLYSAPLMMAFPAVAAILIGGASVERATVTHALIGAFLFQALLTAALPVANDIVPGNFSEVARIIVSNGIILYAVTRKT